ncbi:hypothetical protein K474DRAFT_1708609 [Panus rudis PR-1116 ss-1]|nr:hypothetical protein K474DRAFT_1708609 [Panus rudis PR-1116 ss-1]
MSTSPFSHANDITDYTLDILWMAENLLVMFRPFPPIASHWEVILLLYNIIVRKTYRTSRLEPGVWVPLLAPTFPFPSLPRLSHHLDFTRA